LASLLPREGKFFDYFNEHVGHAVLAAVELRTLLGDLVNLEAHQRNIERHEKQADQITHQTIQLLHQTFITLLDRDEIHQLITTMDDILDPIKDTAQCLFPYEVRAVTAEAQAEICVGCTERLRDAIGKLESMDNGEAILKLCAEIDRLETDADYVMRSAMAKLFREEPDAKEVTRDARPSSRRWRG
jgi:uncharacterized protein Yka (UPF0111/DUF47 family)